jgi:4'-phosphopantetheinyl transferase
VHVWRVTLDSKATRLRRLERHLSADERARAARFRFDRDRSYFIAARGLLREIVSLYLNTLPNQLSFRYGAHGKPHLVQEGYSDLRLNVSHSSGTALFAVTQGREVGVDIEHISPDIPVEKLAETVFSAPEKHALSGLDGNSERAAFFRFWTRKEAYIKADGRGVSLPLERIDVSSSEDRVATLDEATGAWRTCERWMLWTFGVGQDHAAALAAEGQDWHLVCRQWPG